MVGCTRLREALGLSIRVPDLRMEMASLLQGFRFAPALAPEAAE